MLQATETQGPVRSNCPSFCPANIKDRREGAAILWCTCPTVLPGEMRGCDLSLYGLVLSSSKGRVLGGPGLIDRKSLQRDERGRAQGLQLLSMSLDSPSFTPATWAHKLHPLPWAQPAGPLPSRLPALRTLGGLSTHSSVSRNLVTGKSVSPSTRLHVSSCISASTWTSVSTYMYISVYITSHCFCFSA